MALTASHIQDIIRAAGSVIINSSDYTVSQLQDIARTAKSQNKQLTIIVANLNVSDLWNIARAVNNVTFGLS